MKTRRTPGELRHTAEHYRELARFVGDERTVTALLDLATAYERMAGDIECRDAIRARAHQMWIDEGQPDGRAQEHWFRAEREHARLRGKGSAAACP